MRHLTSVMTALAAVLALAACTSDEPEVPAAEEAAGPPFDILAFCAAPAAVEAAPEYVPGGENVTQFLLGETAWGNSFGPEVDPPEYPYPGVWTEQDPALVVCSEYVEPPEETDCGAYGEVGTDPLQGGWVYVTLQSHHVAARIYEARTGALLEERTVEASTECPEEVDTTNAFVGGTTEVESAVAESREVWALFADYVNYAGH